jgi:hypothetical protein
MYDVPMHEPSQQFARCWNAALRHIEGHAQGATNIWLKADLNPPFLEHLSFRLGNQLFYVRIEDVDGRMEVPGNRGGLLTVADACNGHACSMPMHRGVNGWEAWLPGWGLEDARTRLPLDPPALITDEFIEMTDWELHDFAVQVVRDFLLGEGRHVMSTQGNPQVHPSIWCVGDDGPEWVVVCAARHPQGEALPPRDLAAIARSCRHASATGHLASVSIASADDPLDARQAPTPLWRGHGMEVNFAGLVPVGVVAGSLSMPQRKGIP